MDGPGAVKRLVTDACMLYLVTMGVGAAFGQHAMAPALTARSVVFDKDAADLARMRQAPEYVERIFVEAYDPDVPRVPRKTLERRFSDTLLAAPSAAAVGLRPLDTTPCMSLASTWNNIGASFAPMSGCPR